MSKMKSASLVCATLFVSVAAWGSVKPTLEVEGALRLPIDDRISQIKQQGESGEVELTRMAFDESEPLQNRWRAITALGRVYPQTSRKSLEKAMKSPEWFMRNAAIIVAPYNDKAWATKWSRLLMHDPALVVRTAAVRVIRQINATDTSGLLWEKLYSSENYRGTQSLWIRRHIIEALSQFAVHGDEQKFIGVLNDKDKSLHPLAIQALKKLTKQKYETPTQWTAWWNNSQTLTK